MRSTNGRLRQHERTGSRLCALALLLLCPFTLNAAVPTASLPDLTLYEAPTEVLQNQLNDASGDHRLHILTALIERRRGLSQTEVAPYVEELQTALGSYPDSPLKAEASNQLSYHFLRIKEFKIGVDYAQNAYALADALSDDTLLAGAYLNYALAKWRQGNLDAGLVDASRSVELYLQAKDLNGAADAQNLLARMHRSSGDFDNALDFYRQSLALSEQSGSRFGVARAYQNIGIMHAELQQYEVAKTHFEEALDFARETGKTNYLIRVLNNLSLIHIYLQQPIQARTLAEEALALGAEDDDPAVYASLLANLGEASVLQGDNDAALQHYKAALKLYEALEDKHGTASSLGKIGRVYQKTGSLQEAADHLESARDIARTSSFRFELSEYITVLAAIYEQQGNFPDALAALREAQEIEEELKGEEARQQLAALESARELAEKELALSRQAQRQSLLMFISALLVILSIALIAYSRSRSRHLAVVREKVHALQQTTASLTESEARYRSVFNDLFVPKLLVDLNSNTIYDANDVAVTLYRIPRDQIPGLALDDLAPDWLKEAIVEAQDAADNERCISKQWHSDANTLCCADVWFAPVQLASRPHVVVMVHDTTEKTRLEEDRIRFDKLESLGTLAGGIAHNFNNALFAILGRITLAKFDIEKGQSGTASLVEAEKAVDQTVKLANSLLAFSKGGEPNKEVQDLRSLLTEASTLAMSGSSAELKLMVASELWWARVDANQIKQLMTNLILNGLQAIRHHGTLEVRASNYTTAKSLSPATDAGNYVRIQVIDHGPGIPSEIREKVMDPYFSTTGGSGLGLASALAIAARHQGWLTFESVEQEGSTFTVYLPAVDATEVVQVDPSGSATGGRLLVMDDDAAVQGIYQEALRQFGYEVAIASEGSEAVALYEDAFNTNNRFDLVIMDLTVPGGMGGKEAMQEILTRDKHAVGIVASGYSSDPVIANYQEYGFSAALAKPFSLTTLAEVIAKTIPFDSRAQSLSASKQ